MNNIKTSQKKPLEILNECVCVLKTRYLPSVGAIYGATDKGAPLHIGSCTFLNYLGKKYLATAAHLIDNSEFSTLYIGIDGGILNVIAGEFSITSKPQGERKNDKIDLALLAISDELALGLSNAYFIPESEWQLQSLPSSINHGLMLGYPNSKNKFKNIKSQPIKLNPFLYESMLIDDSSVYDKSGLSPSLHHLLDFGEKSRDTNGTIINPTSPKGVSGGGLFYMGQMKRLESHVHTKEYSGKFLGILIEQRTNINALVFTRISVIKKVLELYYSPAMSRQVTGLV